MVCIAIHLLFADDHRCRKWLGKCTKISNFSYRVQKQGTFQQYLWIKCILERKTKQYFIGITYILTFKKNTLQTNFSLVLLKAENKQFDLILCCCSKWEKKNSKRASWLFKKSEWICISLNSVGKFHFKQTWISTYGK